MTAPAYCNLHDRVDCSLCDECGHDVTSHIDAWASEASWFVYANATCWAESICRECDPTAFATATGPGSEVPV